jgi:hypothetical protein
MCHPSPTPQLASLNRRIAWRSPSTKRTARKILLVSENHSMVAGRRLRHGHRRPPAVRASAKGLNHVDAIRTVPRVRPDHQRHPHGYKCLSRDVDRHGHRRKLHQRTVDNWAAARSAPVTTSASLGPAGDALTEAVGPFDRQDLRLIRACGVTSNYLPVGEIYLMGHPVLDLRCPGRGRRGLGFS